MSKESHVMQLILSDKAKKLFEWLASRKLYLKSSFRFNEIQNAEELEIADEDELLHLIRELHTHPEIVVFDEVYDGIGPSAERFLTVSGRAAKSWSEYQQCEQQVICPDCRKPILLRKIVRYCPECGHEHEEY